MITGSTAQSAFFTKDVDDFDDLFQPDLNLQLVAIEKPVPGIPALPPDHVADPLSPECSATMEIDLEGLHDVDNRNFFGLHFSIDFVLDPESTPDILPVHWGANRV